MCFIKKIIDKFNFKYERKGDKNKVTGSVSAGRDININITGDIDSIIGKFTLEKLKAPNKECIEILSEIKESLNEKNKDNE